MEKSLGSRIRGGAAVPRRAFAGFKPVRETTLATGRCVVPNSSHVSPNTSLVRVPVRVEETTETRACQYDD